MLCDDLEGWDRGEDGERLKTEEIHVYLQLVHIVVQQKLTQHYNEIIFQFKNDQIKNYPEQKTLWEAKDFCLIPALLFTRV